MSDIAILQVCLIPANSIGLPQCKQNLQGCAANGDCCLPLPLLRLQAGRESMALCKGMDLGLAGLSGGMSDGSLLGLTISKSAGR